MATFKVLQEGVRGLRLIPGELGWALGSHGDLHRFENQQSIFLWYGKMVTNALGSAPKNFSNLLSPTANGKMENFMPQ